MLHSNSSSCVYRKYGKRLTDILLSFAGFVLLAPIFLIITVWVKLDSKGPVLFKQKRIGKNKSYFNILKFRTMRIDAPKDVPTHLLENADVHITRSGRFLRKTSLDELPQLWNILLGQMSLIGPRPALWNQEDLILARDKYVANDMRPGLTGWAQINGRDELGIETKAQRDGEYARSVSIRMDLLCFASTFAFVLKRTGVIEGGTGAIAQGREEKNQEMAINK